MARGYLHFDGMTWPDPRDPNEVAWRLAYGTPSKSDLHQAVSFMHAYQQLVKDSQRERNSKVSRIRKAMAGSGIHTKEDA